MFSSWKKWLRPPHSDSPPVSSQRPEPVAGGEDERGPALAGPLKDEPPATGSGRRSFPRRTPEERADLLALYAKSPLTPEEFCAAHEIKPDTFKVWLRRTKKTVDPRFSRRFTPEERREAVEAFLKSGRTRGDFVRLWGCSPSSLDKWLERYRAEGPKGLETRVRKPGRKRRQHPKRLSDKVRQLILDVRAEHESFGAQRVADHLSRFHGVKVSCSAVRKILRENGVAGQPFPQRRPRPKSHLPRRFERARPGELWQTDITSFVLRRHGRRVYLTVYLDDHSRYIVAWALATHQRSVLVIEPLLEGIARFGKPREVLADQGRQYFAWRGKSAFQKLLAKEGIGHVVSRAHHPQTLGKCERLWKTIGDEFWDRAKPEDLDDARRRLGHWIRHYNHFRPHQGIGGLVPADRFFDAESQLRAGLEKELCENELRLALDESPRKPVYLVGQIGDERIALHGERGRLVIDTPDGGRREIAMKDLGIERTDKNTKETEDGNGQERAGNRGTDADLEEDAQPSGPQTLGVSEGPTRSLAGAGAVGERPGGGEAAGARDVHEDARVLAGQEEQVGGGKGARDHSAAGLAAEPTGALGDDGGALDAAEASRGSRGLRGQAEPVADGPEEAHRGTGEGALADGRPGASAEMCPVAERGLGYSREGRSSSCSQEETQAEGACREKRDSESGSCSGESGPRGRRWLRWLKRTE